MSIKSDYVPATTKLQCQHRNIHTSTHTHTGTQQRIIAINIFLCRIYFILYFLLLFTSLVIVFYFCTLIDHVTALENSSPRACLGISSKAILVH